MKATGNFENARNVDPMVVLSDETRAHIDHWVAKFPPDRKRSAVIQGLFFGRTAPHRSERRTVHAPEGLEVSAGVEHRDVDGNADLTCLGNGCRDHGFRSFARQLHDGSLGAYF